MKPGIYLTAAGNAVSVSEADGKLIFIRGHTQPWRSLTFVCTHEEHAQALQAVLREEA